MSEPMVSPLLAVPVPVHMWPKSAHLVRAASHAQGGLLVIGVATPMSAQREVGRERIRIAVRQTLGALLGRPPDTIALISAPGRPLRADLPDHRIGLSISHEPGLALAAICVRGAVGIDLMRIEEQTGGEQNWQAVARDYLSSRACARIAAHPPALRPLAFAQEWTRHEACLKCHGLALTEWHPALEYDIGRCRMSALDLPAGLVGTVATCG
jgi:4'-phosphopantetheinyl transferase